MLYSVNETEPLGTRKTEIHQYLGSPTLPQIHEVTSSFYVIGFGLTKDWVTLHSMYQILLLSLLSDKRLGPFSGENGINWGEGFVIIFHQIHLNKDKYSIK